MLNDEFIKEISENPIPKKCKNIVIYGNNNGGKTYILKNIYHDINNNNVKQSFSGQTIIPTIYISINRIVGNKSNLTALVKPTIDATYFDKIKDVYDIEDISQIRKYIESTNSEVVKKALKEIFSSSETYSIEKYDDYSDGVKNVINILCVMHYFYDIYSINTKDTNKVAIVLIDEIELYMHAKNQIRFVEFLNSYFKNVRFIFTSHSPFLIQRINKIDIYNISNDHNIAIIRDNLFYKSLDELYTSYFDISYPQDLKSFLEYLDLCISNINSFDLKRFRDECDYIRNHYQNYNLTINEILLEFMCSMDKKYSKKWEKIISDIH